MTLVESMAITFAIGLAGAGAVWLIQWACARRAAAKSPMLLRGVFGIAAGIAVGHGISLIWPGLGAWNSLVMALCVAIAVAITRPYRIAGEP